MNALINPLGDLARYHQLNDSHQTHSPVVRECAILVLVSTEKHEVRVPH